MLSGRLCSGKTTLARTLTADGSRLLISARAALRELGGVPLQSRAELQVFGAAADMNSDGRWLADYAKRAADDGSRASVVVDSARTLRQVEQLHLALDGDVLHVHLTASDEVLNERFRSRRDAEILEAGELATAEAGELSDVAESLASRADIVIDTSAAAPAEIAARVLASLAR